MHRLAGSDRAEAELPTADASCTRWPPAGSAALMIDTLDGSPVRQLTAYPRATSRARVRWRMLVLERGRSCGDLRGRRRQPVAAAGAGRRGSPADTSHGPERAAAAPCAVRRWRPCRLRRSTSARCGRPARRRDDANGSTTALPTSCFDPMPHSGRHRRDVAGVERARHAVGHVAHPTGHVRSAPRWRSSARPAAVQQVRFDARRHDRCACATTTAGSTCGSATRPLVDEPFEHGGPAWGMGQRSYAVSPDGRRDRVHAQRARLRHGCAWSTSTAVRSARLLAGCTASCRGAAAGSPRCGPGRARRRRVVVYDDATWERSVVAIGPLSGWEDLPLAEPDLVEITAARRRDRCTPGCTGPMRATDRLLCWLHGGPTDQWQVTFMPRIAYWRAQGWNVLVPDHRGSTGHGRAYQQAMRGRWGELDVSDIVDAIVHAHDHGWGSPAHTAIVGRRPGASPRSASSPRDPDLVAAGDRRRIPSPTSSTSPNAAIASSSTTPIRSSARCPMQRSCTATDRRVNFAERLTAHPIAGDARRQRSVSCRSSRAGRSSSAARRAGGDVELVVYEGEGHGFRKPENQLDEYRRMQGFLASARSWRIASRA